MLLLREQTLYFLVIWALIFMWPSSCYMIKCTDDWVSICWDHHLLYLTISAVCFRTCKTVEINFIFHLNLHKWTHSSDFCFFFFFDRDKSQDCMKFSMETWIQSNLWVSLLLDVWFLFGWVWILYPSKQCSQLGNTSCSHTTTFLFEPTTKQTTTNLPKAEMSTSMQSNQGLVSIWPALMFPGKN
jgi:hypothetical protein